jgi:3-oxoacyl-[acyl-carrier protein] reductase
MPHDKQVAVITGATRGIGLAVAQRFYNEGMSVVIAGRDEILAFRVAAGMDVSGGSSVVTVKVDVRRQEDVERMVKTVMDKFGRLDILVNNAGIIRDNIIVNTGVEHWQEVIDTNLTGPFLCTKYAAREMVVRKYGRIINISSIASKGGGAGQAAYAASKSGLEAFTRIAAVELGRKNITVNAIAPGSIRTGMTEELLKKREKELTGKIPLKRIGEPGDIAEMALFLSSEAATYITGQTIYVSGGLGLTYKT